MEPVKVFISYAHKDEAYKDKLVTSFASLKRRGYISAWEDRQIPIGGEWDHHIKSALNDADIILLMISMDFMNSEYCFDVEVKRAIERHNDPNDNARVVPVIVRPSDWTDSEFARLQALPKGAKPISKWEDQDEAFLDVVNQLKQVIREMRGEGKKTAEPIPEAIPQHAPVESKPEINTNPITEFRELISNGKTGKAIELMLNHLKDKDEDMYNQFILQSSRFKSLERQERMGVLDSRTAQVQRAQINYALLEFSNDL